MATGEMVTAGAPSADLCGRKGTGSGAVARGLVVKPYHRRPSSRMAQTQVIMTRFGLTTVASVLRGIAAQTTSRRC
jgi:hypothetical protein